MNKIVLISLAVVALAIIIAVIKTMSKRNQKKKKSFAKDYHHDLQFAKRVIEKMEFEQVSIDHFNAASSKGLKMNKQEIKKENKLVNKPPTPRMGM